MLLVSVSTASSPASSSCTLSGLRPDLSHFRELASLEELVDVVERSLRTPFSTARIPT